MNPLNIGLALLACTAVVTVAGGLARIKRYQIAHLEHALKSFYRNATALLSQPDVPEVLVKHMEMSARTLGSRWKLLGFVLLVLALRLIKAPSRKAPKELQNLPSPVKAKYYTAVNAFLTALCWQSLFLGWAFRKATTPFYQGEDSTKSAAEVELIERFYARAA